MPRKNWDEYFMDLAEEISEQSTCLRRAVGAIAVKDKRILATGFNGAPAGLEHCEFSKCYRTVNNIPSGKMHELCLHGDTKIKLLNGTSLTLKEMAESNEAYFWVYSYDLEKNTIVPGLATNVRMTRKNSSAMKVTFDNGASLILTEDHKLLRRDGVYVEAKDLKTHDSIMPLYYNKVKNGFNYYEHINTHRKGSQKIKVDPEWRPVINSIPTHKVVAEYFSEIPYDDVHHRDENSLNNIPRNLELLQKSDHVKNHYIERPAEFYREMGKKGNETQARLLKTDQSFLKFKQETGSKNMKSNWDDPEFRKRSTLRNVELGKKTAKILNSDPAVIKKRSKSLCLAGINNLIYTSNKSLSEANYEEIRELFPVPKSIGKAAPSVKTILKYFNSVSEALREAETYNHKIIKIEFLEDLYDMYDMYVEKYHNFLIDLEDDSGIFSSNCHAVHAEQNIIAQAAKYGISLEGATVYVNTFPCSICAKLMINVGIARVIVGTNDYPDDFSKGILSEASGKLEVYYYRREKGILELFTARQSN